MSRDALVVGINQYYSLKPLKTPAADAEAIAQYLEKYGNFQVVHRLPLIIQDDQFTVDAEVEPTKLVTAAKLEQALSQLFNPEGTHIPETALFFFAGHGHRKNIGGILEGYLVTSETNPNRRDWGVSLKWLRALLQKSPIKQQVVWLDCCYSGELLNFDEADPGDRGAGYGRCFIAASREYEAAYESASSQHGILTEVLLQKLGADRMVDNYALTDFIQQNLKQSVQQPLTHNSGSRILLTRQPIEPDTAKRSGECPYKGLRFFDEADAKYFYGRDDLTDELIEKVRLGNFLAVLGVSGSGKSSVVRAGLLHQLKLGKKLGESRQWHICEPFTPNEKEQSPFDNLARVLVAADLPDAMWLQEFDSVKYLLQKGAAGFKQWLDKIEAPHVVLVIDQFEEFFTRCDFSERQQFFECVLGCLPPPEAPGAQFCLVITMRADFLGKCAEQDYAGLTRFIDAHQVTVTPMSETELEAAISEPAKQVGLDIEAELITAMLKEVEGPASLPLLEYTLTELWQHRQMNCLTLAEYMRLGGVQGTLQKSADRAYAALTAVEQSVTQWIFLALTQLGEGTEDTRKQILKTDLVTAQHSAGLIDQVLDKLATARLVVVDALGSRGDKQPLVTVIDVAHEALIRHWGKLRKWLDENRSALTKKREIETAAKDWEVDGKSKAYLLQEPKLGTAEDYVNNDADKVPLSNLAQEFVRKSVKYRQKRRYSFIGVVTAVILVLAGSAFYANKQRIEAERQKEAAQIAQSEAEKSEKEAKEQAQTLFIEKLGTQSILATQVPSFGNGYYEHALLLAIQAFKEKDIVTSRSNLLRVLQTKKQRKAFLYGHSSDVYSVAFSPDGQTLASGSSDKTVRLWDVATRQPLGEPLISHSSFVCSVTFSPDGKILASGSSDKTVKLWNIETRKLLGTLLASHSGKVSSVAFSPDGKTLASGGNSVILWNIETKKPLSEPLNVTGHFPVKSVVFSPDGKTLASWSRDSVRLWDVNTRKPLGEALTVHSHNVFLFGIPYVNGVVFSPNGNTLAGISDKTLILWNFETRKPLGEALTGHSFFVNSVVFSPDGKTLASGSWDNTVRLWNFEKKKPFGEPLVGHSDVVWSIVFSPDGKTLASGSRDNTVRLWDFEKKKSLGEPLRLWDFEKKSLGYPLISHSDVFAVLNFSISSRFVFSPDSKTLTSISQDKTVILWNIDTRKPLGKPLAGYSDNSDNSLFSFSHAALSPDGKTLAFGNFNTVRLWDVETRKPFGKLLSDNSSPISSMAFSSDGKTLALANDSIVLWDIDTKKPLGEPLVGHSNNINRMVFSPNGKILASGSFDKSVRLWDVETKKPLGKPLAAHSDFISNLAFSPDGNLLASGNDNNTVILWNVETRKLLGEPLTGYSFSVDSVAFSPDSKTLASGGSDGVRLWNVETGQPLGEPLVSHLKSVKNVAFSPNGKFLASGGDDGVILWDVNPESWAKKACAIVNRNFSHKEWQKYMGNRPHEKTCPNLPKDTLGAIELTKQARKLLKEGKTELAKSKFAQAREWDANVVFGDEGLE